MTEDDAFDVLAVLVAAFNGWTEPKMEMWKSQLMELRDAEAGFRTAKAMAGDATDTFIPGFGAFKATYDRWARRLEEQREEAVLALQEGEYSKMKYPDFENGVRIAWDAYIGECGRQGKTPNKDYFDAWMGKGRSERRAQVARSGR